MRARSPWFRVAVSVLLSLPSGLQAAIGEAAATPEAPRRSGASRPRTPLDQGLVSEVEPNGTAATATPMPAANAVLLGHVFAAGDLDFYSFSAQAGDRVYVATMGSFTASSNDTVIDLLNTDGATVIESDNNDGVFGNNSSSIAGATIPGPGTYYIRVSGGGGTALVLPYHLHFQLRSGSPTPETEPNNVGSPQALPVSGWVSGTINPAADTDAFSLNLNAGDTVFLSLDLNPERDGVFWNGRLGLGSFGSPPLIPQVDDPNAGSAGNPNSEAFFWTVQSTGTYFVDVDHPPGTGSATFTYHLSVSVHPNTAPTGNCATYTSTDVPQTIPAGPGQVASTITVPGNPRIADVNVSIQLTHTNMPDLDVHLVAPAGNDVGLFSDIGASSQQTMNVTLDDEGAIPIAYSNIVGGTTYTPREIYRLSWFDGEDAGGVWTLVITDDTAANGGMLTGWSLRICQPPPPPACGPGTLPVTAYTSNFEANDGSFTHSGAADEWARGLPTAAPITTCNSGTNCWKTDLAGTYNSGSNQDLLSPAIDLTTFLAPVQVTWAQKYQMHTAANDRYFVEVRQTPGGANPRRLFEWLDGVMTDSVGSPPTNVNMSAGWGVFRRDISSYAGQNVELRFHLDSDPGATNLAGAAIDDVAVTACRVLSADLAITKTDGVTNAVPGASVTYTITATNDPTSADPAPGATVTDTFPAACASVNWTCVAAGGGTCTAGGSGNISDTVDLPPGATATYTATCNIAPGATGSLANTATITIPGVGNDPFLGNNSATDTDTLVPTANLAITKTDGVASAAPGGSTTYTIVASNPGPSNAPGSTVADTFPAACTSVNWTCAGAGGGTCPASGSGNIGNTVSLPSGGSVTYTATCNISSGATGSLANTATVAPSGSVTDPVPGNNSATDTDTLVPTADLAITKTDGAANAVPGSSTTYTIVASNPGPSNAPSSTVTDTFPAACTSVNWTCVGAGGGTCTASSSGNIGDTVNLPSGGSVTYTATCNISAGATGSLSNTATVAPPGSVTDPVPGNNSATDTDTLVPTANLAITKTDGALNAVPGGSTTYTIVASNPGPSDAPGSTVADTFPAACTSVNWTCVGAGGGTCTASSSGNINDTVSLPSGGSVTYSATCNISPGATGSLANTSTVAPSGSVTDPVPGNNSATDTDTLVPTANLAITKTDGALNAVPGGSTTYTIVASNPGPSDAPGSTVADTFPAACTSVNWTCIGAGGGTCTASSSGNVNDTVSLPSGGSVTYTATCNISPGATGSLANTSTIAPSGSVTDPVPGNNSATDTDTLVPTANLAITKTDGATNAVPGGSTTYTIVASNPGPSNAPGSTVTDTFPAACTSVNWTCVGAGGGTCTASSSGNINDTVSLPSGGSVTYTATCNISPGATGSLANTATVAPPGSVTDPVPGNNSATDTDTLVPTANLAITKTDGVASAAPGGSTTYTIVASNPGPSNAPSSTVTDTFPAACTSVNWTCVGAGGGTCTASSSGNISDTVNLPSGGSVTYTATCNISLGAAGTLANTATVAPPGSVTDPVPGNNSATDTDTLVPTADLSITKTDGVTSVQPGTSTTYTIVASNPGPSNAPGSTVTDSFPAACTSVNWTCVGAGGGTCTASSSGNISDTVNLPSGGSVTYTATCNISPAATGSLVNTATVAPAGSVTDPVPGNNSATDTDIIGAAADLSITKSDGQSSAIPGQTATYTIVASSAGPSAAPGSTVTDTFPAACTTVNWTCIGAGGGTCTASGSGNISDTVSLPSGATLTYTAGCSIAPTATGTLSNTATVAPPGGLPDPAPGNNSASDSDTLTPQADLAVSLADAADPLIPGATLSLTATLNNIGPSTSTGMTFALNLPAGVTFVSSTPTSPTCVHSSGTVTCNLPGLAPAGNQAVNVSATVDTGTLGLLTTTASVAGNETDPVTGNDSDSETTTVKGVKGDFSIDGKVDILFQHTLSGRNVVWFMNGITRTAGYFTNPSQIPDTNWRMVGTADFDADEKTDILFRHTISGRNVVWYMDGITRTNGVFTDPDQLADTNWRIVGTGEFSTPLDGKPDLLYRHAVSGKNVVWYMDGVTRTAGVFTNPSVLADTNWQMVGVGDFSSPQDGKTDILWRHGISGKNVVWYMDGITRTNGVFTNPDQLPDTNWMMSAVGDYSLPLDDKPDILFRHAISGKNVVWYMDGITRTLGVFTNPDVLPDTHWRIVGPR